MKKHIHTERERERERWVATNPCNTSISPLNDSEVSTNTVTTYMFWANVKPIWLNSKRVVKLNAGALSRKAKLRPGDTPSCARDLYIYYYYYYYYLAYTSHSGVMSISVIRYCQRGYLYTLSGLHWHVHKTVTGPQIIVITLSTENQLNNLKNFQRWNFPPKFVILDNWWDWLHYLIVKLRSLKTLLRTRREQPTGLSGLLSLLRLYIYIYIRRFSSNRERFNSPNSPNSSNSPN